MNHRPRILVCDPLHEDALAILRQDADIDVRPDINKEQLQEIIGRYQALVVGPQRSVTHDMLEEALNLRVIGCTGPSLDHIDVTTARQMGVEVRVSPSSNAVAIAEHTLRLMLQLTSRNREQSLGGLAGKTLGIVGFGRVGRQVARRAVAFDMQIIVNQPRLTPELALDAAVVTDDLVNLLQESDFVSLHVPFRAETEALIGAEELAAMKRDAYLLNTGHTDLVDDAALLAALEEETITGAVLPEFPKEIAAPSSKEAILVREHPRVLVAPHVTTIIGDRKREGAVSIARQVVKLLREKQPSESLSLEVVPVEQVTPHEQIDEKRVARLAQRLENESRLINPPIVTYWNERYVILDGATRFTALQRLGYPHLIVQVVDPGRHDYELHTWYHVISATEPAAKLFDYLARGEGLKLSERTIEEAETALRHENALCYFLDREGNALLAQAEPGTDRIAVMNQLVSRYSEWGLVERTLLTDLSRLRAQFPEMKALAVFPQFEPERVFAEASRGKLLPAGLTRFVIPGRILRLNADLERLKADEPLAAKRAWFNEFLAEKLARSRLRYYQEPVILLEE